MWGGYIIKRFSAAPSGGNYNTTITYVAGTLNVTNPIVHVTGVMLNKTDATLTVGGTETLTATVAPGNATDKNVTWASSNTAVATVDSNGKVTAVSAGAATITVTTTDGAKTATCTVTVTTGSGSYVPSAPSTPSTPAVTVPVSSDRNSVVSATACLALTRPCPAPNLPKSSGTKRAGPWSTT